VFPRAHSGTDSYADLSADTRPNQLSNTTASACYLRERHFYHSRHYSGTYAVANPAANTTTAHAGPSARMQNAMGIAPNSCY
jgi:hypothetical protein